MFLGKKTLSCLRFMKLYVWCWSSRNKIWKQKNKKYVVVVPFKCNFQLNYRIKCFEYFILHWIRMFCILLKIFQHDTIFNKTKFQWQGKKQTKMKYQHDVAQKSCYLLFFYLMQRQNSLFPTEDKLCTQNKWNKTFIKMTVLQLLP